MTPSQLELHLPAPSVTGDEPLVPARMVNEFVYCPRLAYLVWGQAEWAESGDTVERRRVHVSCRPYWCDASDARSSGSRRRQGSQPLAHAFVREPRRDQQRVTSPHAEDGTVTPIDYKWGKWPHLTRGAYEPERVQVCLQALLLDEHGYRVEEGAIWYAKSRERVRITLNDELRQTYARGGNEVVYA